MPALEDLIQRAVDPRSVHIDGTLSTPPSFGVYLVMDPDTGMERYRFGAHPVRQQELEDQFGACDLEYLFLNRADAAALASLLNKREA